MTILNQGKKTYPLIIAIIGALSFFLMAFVMGLTGIALGFDLNIMPL